MKKNQKDFAGSENSEIETLKATIESAELKLKNEISHRKDVEEKLKRTEAKYQNILGSIEDGYYEVDLSGNFIFFNDSLCKILGYTRNELPDIKLDDFTDKENIKKGYKAFNEVYSTGVSKKDFGWEIISKGGIRKNVEASISLIYDLESRNKPIGFRGILRDITQRKEAEELLLKSEERFRVLVEKNPLGISLMDRNNYYKYINPKFIDMFGYVLEEIPTGRDWLRKAFPDDEYRKSVISSYLKNIKEHEIGETRPQTHDVHCKDGSVKLINFRSVTMETGEQINFCEDITEQRRLESHLAQAQKVESLATLAGGMAHNFNNLLMGIQGNISLMLLETNHKHTNYSRLKNIEKLVQKGAKLTHQLLGYAREGNYEIRPISLNQLVTETSETFALTRKEIRIKNNLSDDGGWIIADQGQIDQVLLNLYINAADAMPDGGDIILETRDINAKQMKDKPYKPKPGEYVLLTFRDTGEGMDKKTMKRIFDPFFTTKAVGKGTGLGLASVYGIIKAHGGYIDVDSKKGQGTVFSIYLPKSKIAIKEPINKKSKIVKGSETILIVEDEDMVLEIVVEYLQSLGYNIFHAAGGLEAVEIYKEKHEEIDLVILDLIMPDMSGSETYNLLKSINPEVKVLLSSGYDIKGKASDLLKIGCNGFIQKPFDMEMLSQSIKDILH